MIKENTLTAHLWYGGHSTSINVCGGMKGKDRGSSLQEGTLHTYTLKLD